MSQEDQRMLAKRRRDILAAIQTLRMRDEVPTYRRIAGIVGLSYSAVRYHLKTLKRWGYVDWVPKKENTLVLMEWQTYD